MSEINNDSGIIYPYIICGVTVTVTGVIFYILHCQNVLKKIGEQNASIEDKREDAPLNTTLMCFFVSVIINLFGIQVTIREGLKPTRLRTHSFLKLRNRTRTETSLGQLPVTRVLPSMVTMLP